MELSVSHQVFVFAAMILCGVLTGVVFDIFRAVRRCFKSGSGIIALEDIALWITELIIVFVTLFKVNNAAVRFYEIIGLVIGSVLYFITVSQYAIKAFCKVVVFLKITVIKTIVPIVKLFDIICSPAKKIGIFVLNKLILCSKSTAEFTKKRFLRISSVFNRKKA